MWRIVKPMLATVVLGLVLPLASFAQTCLEEVKRRNLTRNAEGTVFLYSPADIAHNIVDPLRGNLLSDKQMTEIKKFVEQGGFEFFEILKSVSGTLTSEFIVVSPDNCQEKTRYKLL